MSRVVLSFFGIRKTIIVNSQELTSRQAKKKDIVLFFGDIMSAVAENKSTQT
jgi:hypothetical protein